MQKLFYALVLFLSISITTHASDYYWVGGSGQWSDYNTHWATSSGGSSFHLQVPTNLDNVYFDANSGFTSGSRTITIDQTIVYCNNMDWTGASFNPILTTTLSSNTIKVFGSLTLIQAMTFSYNADLSFEATATGKNIVSNGQVLPCANVYFNGTGGGWTLTDSLSVMNYLVFNNGTLTTNGKTINAGAFISYGSNARTLNLSSSKVNLTSVYDASLDLYNTFNANITNFTFNAGTSTIYTIGTSPAVVYARGFTFNNFITSDKADADLYVDGSSLKKLLLNSNTVMNGGYDVPTSFDSLVFVAGNTYSLYANFKINDTGKWIANGTCSSPINIQSELAGSYFVIQKAGAAVDLSFVTLQDINAYGGATFNATSSLNIGNVTGWSIVAPTSRNLYWIGGTGNWSDPSHWALSSGGTVSAGCIPSPVDNVYFDANSGFTVASIVTMDLQKGFCKSMDWTGATNHPQFLSNSTKDLYISGSLHFIVNMNANLNGNVIFNSTSTGNTVTSANQSFNGSMIQFKGIGGGWTLADSLSGSNNSTLTLSAGNFNTGGKNIYVGGFSDDDHSFNNVNITLNNSRITLTNSAFALSLQRDTNNVKLYSGTSTIILLNGTISSSSHNYYNVISYAFNSNIYIDNSTFHKLQLFESTSILGIVTNATVTYDSLVLTKGNVYTFSGHSTHQFKNGTLVANGTCSLPIYLQSDSGDPFYFIKNSGVLQVNYAIIKNNQAIGGASFLAYNSFAANDVTGWTINAVTSRNLYWVGNGGSWNDANHWSLTSGGTGGACIPGAYDNVFFNAQSFTATGANVFLSDQRGLCNNIDWTGSLHSPQFNVSTNLEIFGSLTFIPNMTVVNYGIDYVFSSENSATITTGGQPLDFVMFNSQNGTWNQQDKITCKGFFLTNGSYYSHDHAIATTFSFFFIGSENTHATASLFLGNSTVTLQGDMIVANHTPNVISIDAGTSNIILNNGFIGSNISLICNGPAIQLYNMTCTNPTRAVEIYGNITFNKLTLLGPAIFDNSNNFDTLVLTPGRTYQFADGATQTIAANGLLDATGTPGFPIELLSTTSGTQTNISKSGGTVCLDYLFLKDINATGGATFYAGVNGANVSNNSGWLFAACGSTATDEAVSAQDSYNVYPVPSRENFYIDATQGQTATMKLLDSNGKEVLFQELNTSHNEINTKGLSVGLYYVIIYTANKSITKKIMIY